MAAESIANTGEHGEILVDWTVRNMDGSMFMTSLIKTVKHFLIVDVPFEGPHMLPEGERYVYQAWPLTEVDAAEGFWHRETGRTVALRGAILDG
jgi:hypothetical protein